MKTRSLFITALVLPLLASCASRGSLSSHTALLGDPAPLAAATRTVVISPDTKWVNVVGGDTVRFVVGDKAFAWNFSGPEKIFAFALNDVAPAGILDHKVVAYVELDPRLFGGSDRAGMP